VSLAERQLDLLRRMATLDPPPVLIGGWAEDALLAGTATRPHEDVDWIFPRSEHALREGQARDLGFGGFETWGEAAPGEPFYVYAENRDLKIDFGILDIAEGRPLLRIHRLMFEVDGREPPAGYQIVLPHDLFEHEPASIDGIPVQTVTPLALYQIRVGIAGRGSFGALNEKQQTSMQRLRERFFPGRDEVELAPPIEPLAQA